MLKAIISGKWQMPVVKNRQNTNREVIIGDESPLAKKLKSIVIPDINLSSTPLTQAIAFLSQASELFDFSNDQNKGVNIIPNFDPSAEDPLVNLILRNMTLERVLEVLVDQVGYSVELAADVVLISKRKGGKFNRNYTLEFYPLSPSMVLKLTGGASAAPGGPGGAGPADPFGPAPGAGPGMGNGGGEEQAIIDFFIRSGIPLDDPESSTSFDGSQLIVRHNQRTHSMIQDLLRRYDSEATQVEIEAKFLEVQQGDLEELGFNWGFHYGEGDPLIDTETGKPRRDSRGFIIKEHRIGFTPQTRSLADAFTFSSNSSQTTISRGDDIQEYDNSPPRLPNTLDLANGAGDVFKTLADVAQGSSTILGAAQVDLVIKALQRSSGTELLSAPRVTVNNQGQANITIAQEFRYPEDYDPGQIAQSGTGFTGAVPNTFTDRNVGVELSVSPQVGANDTISLHLEPTVTEFEGFVEYGGNNVVISGSGVGGGGVGGVGGGIGGGLGGGIGGFGQQEPVVIVQPSGIYQPIFSVRRVVTDVTIYDGATVVIGGLTREEVKTVNDRVPVLSNIPGLGRLFRSEGESSLKRNLMIFVTGNIISPGGGPARQDLATIERGSVYQNPIVITPAGPERRSGNRSEN
jgi:general secretion pathway protein D